MTKLFVSLLLLLQASVASAKVLSLDIENLFEVTEGKSIFVKFFAPWCDSCREMAPEFERLAMDWQGHEIGLIAEVDCEGLDSEKICDDFQIEALPTILYGDRTNLEFYGGDRTYEAMSAFAKAHVSRPSCSLQHLEYCSEENKQLLVELQKRQ